MRVLLAVWASTELGVSPHCLSAASLPQGVAFPSHLLFYFSFLYFYFSVSYSDMLKSCHFKAEEEYYLQIGLLQGSTGLKSKFISNYLTNQYHLLKKKSQESSHDQFP